MAQATVDNGVWILATDKHARRIISHLISRRLRWPVQFFWLEGEYHILMPNFVDLTRLRGRLKGIDFCLE